MLVALIFTLMSCPAIFAQTVGQIEKTQIELDREKALRERLEKKKKKPEVEKKEVPAAAPLVSKEKVLVKQINVTGVALLKENEVNNIIAGYTNKEITLGDMQKVADLITDAYRQKGYITSRAYLPPQKIETGILEVRVVEGITGDFDIKGNRYFKKALYRNKIALKKAEPFNYEVLRKGLSRINELPDRNIKAVLAPGKEPGTTDVALEVKDRLPIHIGFDWDNYGSRYVNYNRYRTTITDNNLSGLDDVFVLQYQLSEGENYKLLNFRYLLPITRDLKLGFFLADSKIDLRREYEDENLNGRGKTRYYSIYATQALIDKENVNLNLNLGFDYKDILNFQGGNLTSRDLMRVIKTSLDADFTDSQGRTIVNNELSWGIGNIMGGIASRDDSSSRSGAGGEFFKDTLGLLRLQKMPFSSTLLWKNQFQFSPNILTSAEEFQIGGVINVRGYPAAEVVGDRGFSSTLELSMPPYLCPKNIKVPFSQAKFYDALRIVTFYDWGNTHLRRPTATEEKNKTLKAAGFGFRFYLPENFSLKTELAWPLDNTPSDGDHLHTWFEVSKSF